MTKLNLFLNIFFRFFGGAAAPTQRQLLINEEFVPGGIRDITPHLIHHSQGLAVAIYVVSTKNRVVTTPNPCLKVMKCVVFSKKQFGTWRAATDIPTAWHHHSA